MQNPEDVLDAAFQRARNHLKRPLIDNDDVLERVRFIARCLSNRAGARMLITCALAKIHRPELDIRKPYTEIGSDDCFSGRNDYDEAYIWPFASRHNLPVNSTTAFLTPGFRTINVPLAPPLVISGRPKRMYADTLQLLDDVYQGRISAEQLLTETLRQLLILKQEQDERMQQLLDELKTTSHGIPLSSEDIINLLEQHLKSPKSSRLPVLIVAAAYDAAMNYLGRRARPLYAHTAADLQTGALGDIEITLIDEDNVTTSYENENEGGENHRY